MIKKLIVLLFLAFPVYADWNVGVQLDTNDNAAFLCDFSWNSDTPTANPNNWPGETLKCTVASYPQIETIAKNDLATFQALQAQLTNLSAQATQSMDNFTKGTPQQ